MLVTNEPELRHFWYPVCFVEDLESGPVARRLLGVDLVLWRTGDGRVVAARDRCPHRGAALSLGWVESDCVVCPYHGWQFGSDGIAAHIPQQPPGVPVPPKAKIDTARARVEHSLVWVCLDPAGFQVPRLAETSDSAFRVVREFDEVWACSAPRLMDNSFDPSHVAFVHRNTFGDPSQPDFSELDVERTPEGMVLRYEVEVDNRTVEAKRSTRDPADRTVRRTTTWYFAPFSRYLEISYPSGTRHNLFTSASPVDDEHLRIIQFAVRNDSEAEVPAGDVVAFDRLVTLEDQRILESTDPDYDLDLTANVHLRVDRPTVEIRRILHEVVTGAWRARVTV